MAETTAKQIVELRRYLIHDRTIRCQYLDELIDLESKRELKSTLLIEDLLELKQEYQDLILEQEKHILSGY